METGSEIISEDEFVEQYFNEMDTEHNLTLVENSTISICEDEGIEIPKKGKRRANLTEFGASQTTKRKNESAKRELTSIVNQVCTFLTT